ncbi:CD1375 family protein [Candidatus Vagococcus giribetii]|nr:CD1375 family protein [Vagococcus sp. DIV0080]
MVQAYVSLAQKGLKKIEEVPKKIREEIQATLDSEIQE